MSELFEIRNTSIPGCLLINPRVLSDERGLFVKTYHREAYASMGLELPLAEEYYSVSHRRVLRGLHFQTLPMDVIKLVHCIHGEVVDAVVDLRVGSPTYGKHEVLELSGEKGSMLYVPSGLAHGFYVLSPQAILVYKVSKVYSTECDTGIHWASAGIPWPDPNPVVSKRDQEFVPFSEFRSPFKFGD